MVAGYASVDPHSALVRAEQQDSLIRSTCRLARRPPRDRREPVGASSGRLSTPAATIPRPSRMSSSARSIYLVCRSPLRPAHRHAARWHRGGWRSWSFAAFGFFVPDILIYNEGLKREQEMTKKLPDALDLLNLCVESGLSFQAALTQVADEPDGTGGRGVLGRAAGDAAGPFPQPGARGDGRPHPAGGRAAFRVGDDAGRQARRARSPRCCGSRHGRCGPSGTRVPASRPRRCPLKILMPLMLCFLPALFVIILGPAVYSLYKVFSETI